MPVFTRKELKFWEEHGYVVVPGAVPEKRVKAAAGAVWAFAGMDPEDPATWYTDPPREGCMIEIYQHQALWDNRQHPRVHQAFTEIFGTEKLWVSFDRASINPPVGPEYDHNMSLHFDLKFNGPIGLGVQGVLYLSDTPAHQGAFSCIPGFHRQIEKWLAALPEEANPSDHLDEEAAVAVPGRAGDLILWRTTLPHKAGANTGERPRVAQYISMGPAPQDPQARKEARAHRINVFSERLTGLGKNEKAAEHQHGTTAELTPLGRRLLGIDAW